MPPQRRSPLTERQKAIIQDRYNEEQKVSEISHGTQIPRSTISTFLSGVGSDANLQRPGWPRKSSATDDRLIIRKALSNTHQPLWELCVNSNSDLSIRTIKRRLQEYNILRKWKAAKRPGLNESHTSKRYKRARNIVAGKRVTGEKLYGRTSAQEKRVRTHVRYGYFDGLESTRNSFHRTSHPRIKAALLSGTRLQAAGKQGTETS